MGWLTCGFCGPTLLPALAQHPSAWHRCSVQLVCNHVGLTQATYAGQMGLLDCALNHFQESGFIAILQCYWRKFIAFLKYFWTNKEVKHKNGNLYESCMQLLVGLVNCGAQIQRMEPNNNPEKLKAHGHWYDEENFYNTQRENYKNGNWNSLRIET